MDASDVPVEDSDAPSDGDSIEDTAESEDTSPSDAGEGDPLGDAGEPIPPACPEGAYCDDENPCTLEDKCQADGSCVGTAKTCDDTNPCTEDLCDPEDGSCSNNPLSGVPCGLGQECLAGNCEQICEDGTVGSCPVVWEGDALVTDEESLSALSSITHIEGNLSISFYDGILTLPALQSVEGYLVLASTANVSGLNLPALKSVTGAFHLQGGGSSEQHQRPGTRKRPGGVRMENLTTLLSFSMPLLESLGGDCSYSRTRNSNRLR